MHLYHTMMLYKRIFNIQSSLEFEKIAIEIFKLQFTNNKVYRSFCDLLNVHPSDINSIDEIPFLPIEFFKTHQILSNTNAIQQIFTSSGTTGMATSKHYITDISLYKKSYLEGFKFFYGNPSDYVILALLPSYLERKGSSLIYMVDDLIKQSQNTESDFYLNNLDELTEKLRFLDKNGQKVLLIGVSYALLDLIEKHQFQLKNTIVMETGGMKGRRKELIRQELHSILKRGFGLNVIHSEYGMTELLSQAYSKENGIFYTPSWVKIMVRNSEDPLEIFGYEKTGGINIIDLANVNSCSFIATQDLGKIHPDNSFEVLGRFDSSDIRGCNLLIN